MYLDDTDDKNQCQDELMSFITNLYSKLKEFYGSRNTPKFLAEVDVE